MKHLYRPIPHIQQPKNSNLCGAACLQMLYTSYGISLTLDEIWEQVQERDKNTGRLNCHTYRMARHALSLGLKAMVVVCEDSLRVIQTCLESNIDVIALYRVNIISPLGHYSVITGMDNKGIYLNDPWLDASKGKNRIVKPIDFVQLLRPIPGSELVSPNVLLLIAPPGVASTSMASLRHDDCVQDVEFFDAIAPLQPLLVCLEHDRYFSSNA